MSKFYIPGKQRFAMMVFILLILVSHHIDTVYDRIVSPSDEEEINMVKDILSENAIQKEQEYQSIKSAPDISDLPMIDPNIASKEKLAQYGLSKYAINNLDKYRSKGGRINDKEDLLKIYGIDSSVVDAIQDKLALPSKSDASLKSQSMNKSQIYASSTATKEVEISNQRYEELQSPTIQAPLPFFDPNTATKSELLEQGISSYGANNLLKYRSKGGRIYNTKGLSKIYGIDSSVIEMIGERIKIEEEESGTEIPISSFTNIDTSHSNHEITNKILPKKKKSESIQELNINTATQEQLIAIRGIGPVISKGIVEYRNKLGGYHKLDQLLEVYGITDENYNALTKRLFVEGEIEKFYPAGTSFKNLVRHPYIDYETTKLLKSFSIMNYSEELQKLIDEGKIDERLLPYIYISDPETVTIKN